jgi:hypothetical protein
MAALSRVGTGCADILLPVNVLGQIVGSGDYIFTNVKYRMIELMPSTAMTLNAHCAVFG